MKNFGRKTKRATPGRLPDISRETIRREPDENQTIQGLPVGGADGQPVL